MKRVVNIVRKIRPGIRVLIWDDVIRSDQFIINEKLVRVYLYVKLNDKVHLLCSARRTVVQLILRIEL